MCVRTPSNRSERKKGTKEKRLIVLYVTCLRLITGVLHEHPRIGSDGESEEVSLASDPDVTSPVKMRQKNRRLSEVCQFDYDDV